MHVNGHNEEGPSKSLKKTAWKFSTSWSKIQQEESLNSGICFMLLSLCSESHVDLKWAEMCQHVLLQNSTPRQAKNLETAHWRQMPFASFANWQLFCKAAATLTRIPNACLHWRDHINVNDVWYTDVSYIYRYITHKQMYYTQMYYTQRCIIHRISGQRNTQDSDWKKKAQKITKTSEKKACVCSQRITQLNVKRSLYAWLLPAPLSLWKRFGGVSNNLWTFQGVPQNQQSEDIPLQVKSSS